MMLEILFYAVVVAALIIGLSRPLETNLFYSSLSGDIIPRLKKGRYYVQSKQKGRYPSGFR